MKRLLLIPIFAFFIEGCSKLTNDQIVYLECQITPVERIDFIDYNMDNFKYKEHFNRWIYSINNEDKSAYYYLIDRHPSTLLHTKSLDILTFNKEYIFLREVNYKDDYIFSLTNEFKEGKYINEVSIQRNTGELEINSYYFERKSNYKKLVDQTISKGKCKKVDPPKTKF